MAWARCKYQPGAILHDAVMGAFRASGTTLKTWAEASDLHLTSCRMATHGLMRGPRGQALMEKLIAAAGPEIVEAGYEARLRQHLAERGMVR